MAKDKRAPEVEAAFRNAGWAVRAESARNTRSLKGIKLRYVSGAKKAEGDLFCIRQGKGIFVEIKSFGDSWNTKSWTEDQREWARTVLEQGETVYMALVGGVGAVNSKTNPRIFWLIPMRDFLKKIEDLEKVQHTLPYMLSIHSPKKLIAAGGSANQLFGEYRVTYDKGWRL